MKRLELVLMLMLVTVVTTGCQHGRWRLRGARCRPGMTMPTYAQTAIPAPVAAAAPCPTGYPPAAYAPAGYPPTGYAPTGFMPNGYGPEGFMQGGGFVPGETVTSDNVVGEFPTSPIQGPTQVMQRPYVESPVVEEGDVITIPGPETGPLPNG